LLISIFGKDEERVGPFGVGPLAILQSVEIIRKDFTDAKGSLLFFLENWPKKR